MLRMSRQTILVRCAASLVLYLVLAACASTKSETPYNLGVAAYKKKDYSVAATQWAKAVALDDTKAMNNLGFLLYNGYGVDKNVARSMELWRKAAATGESESQWHLGRAYETGVGAERNLSIAFAWYRCSIATVSENLTANTRDHATEVTILQDVQASLDNLQRSLSASQLEQGRALAAEYIAKYAKQAREQPHH